MPDWSYHPIFKPLLFSLPAKTSERLALGAIGGLAALPLGRQVIRFIGHMQPAPELRINSQFKSPVGLGCGFDLDKNSALALSDFGFAFIELGPVTIRPVEGKINRDPFTQTIVMNDVPVNCGLERLLVKFRNASISVPLLVRIAHENDTVVEVAVQEAAQMIEVLGKIATYFVIDTRWNLLNWSESELTTYLSQAVKITNEKIMLVIEPGSSESQVERLVAVGIATKVCGFVVSGGTKIDQDKRSFGGSDGTLVAGVVSKIRALAPGAMLIGGGGILEPSDALTILDAGAEMVELYSGLVYSGPGLPKRINETILFRRNIAPTNTAFDYSIRSVFSSSWLYFGCFGIGLVIACVSAITVGLTTVILPYDETFVRLHHDAFNAINPHLLHFMEHDRITYAGTALSTGLLFAALAIVGIRTGHHWAYAAIRNAGSFGLASFFLFLGYHYLDPLHACVTLSLFPFYCLGIWARKNFIPESAPDFKNDRTWHRSLYGQLMFVTIGIGLMLAGATICYVGTSTVFVPEDLMFMHTTSSALMANHPHLLPAIAHDRAGFGGALVTIGIAVLITSLRGYRRGAGWVWWILTMCALPAFISTLAIHYCIGYTNQWHLLPVYIAAMLYCAGVVLSYEYLCAKNSTLTAIPNRDK